jgi:glycosyltransferase involved in cell wall biosynthesis
MRFLPGFFANVGPQVDAVVALDDGSTDGSTEYLASRPEVVELIRIPSERPAWDEVANHRRLVAAALRHGADWIVSLDADERVERDFRARAERVIARGRPLGLDAYAIRLRELWDRPDRYRVDGIWGDKGPPRLFRALPDHVFDERPIHGLKAPLQARRPFGRFPIADLQLYHLRMIDPDDRQARRARYEQADPDEIHQPGIGYAYLTDTTGLRLRTVSARRGYVE